ncbi:MAG: ABC transporter permease [Gemmatimonadetes bacterium]|uniref:ABC transporter permease n=1 Tax=Candidatus Kutchimonas denitrificans TaxID=3056748 RepID=A0AAE5C7L7_9BACT|nr:ABC transporter permease [Gemmatimonadota bacterium]NIR73561.1 ABC transporter permease [Candidatus Kutchimonas denitrificans]NIR99520.1 ABC transporter permease [Gemmatimonadota bacterium]NIT65140.1 ABC transporter permease [Gemmatimonadota bacterium]NIV23673.1 FtsX-like permease family protein [Gemmatimonadota bacterium]
MHPAGPHVYEGAISIIGETRQAIRRLLKARAFAIPVVLTLGLGIGAVTSIYSVVHDIVLSPLPYPDSRRLVWVDHGAVGLDVERGLTLTKGLYVHYSEESRTLQRLAIYDEENVSLAGEGEPERVRAARATHTLFTALRVTPALGRAFDATEDRPGGRHVVILDHSLWTRRFGADTSTIGKTVRIDGAPHEVIGVMPRGFHFPGPDIELWRPLIVEPISSELGSFSKRAIGRLAPNATPELARSELQTLIGRLDERFPDELARRLVNDVALRARVVALKDRVVGDMGQVLWILLGSVAVLLLIACVNVANLFLVRAEEGRREVAVRTALGAGYGRLVRHFFVEAIVLAVLGGVVALALAAAGLRLLSSFGPEMLPRLHEVGLDLSTFAFTALVALAAAVFFALIPLSVTRAGRLADALRAGGRGASSGRRGRRARTLLVVGQVAMALTLLIGALLMARSYWNLRNVDPGFEPDRVLTFQIGLNESQHPTRAGAVAFHRHVTDRLANLPGVESVGLTTCLPLCGSWSGSELAVEGRTLPPGVIAPVVAIRRVSAGYFETLKIELKEGRTLRREDLERRSGAAVVSARLATLYWPDRDPIGQRIYHGDEANPAWYTVVGVVNDLPIRELGEPAAPTLYLPLLHRHGAEGPLPYTLSYALRSTVPPTSLAGAIRAKIAGLDPDLPIAGLKTLERIVVEAGTRMAFSMTMLLVAATLALALGAVGIYGVVAYAVRRRRQEIGVRLALGARAADVQRLVLWQSAIVVSSGLAVGILASFGLTRLLRSLLFELSPLDPVSFAVAVAVLLAAALAGTCLPVRRAATVDPMETLRTE